MSKNTKQKNHVKHLCYPRKDKWADIQFSSWNCSSCNHYSKIKDDSMEFQDLLVFQWKAWCLHEMISWLGQFLPSSITDVEADWQTVKRPAAEI